MIKRLFDILAALLGITFLAPFFVLISILIKSDSKGPIFYRQSRIGRYGKEFKLVKFRTMSINADKSGLLTISSRDNRITRVGYYLRKYKIDELPQLINVLIGDMSLVGPRPEVKKYVDLYTKEQLKVLNFKPGITDVASIKYSNENKILETKKNPEEYYIKIIMQDKLNCNLEYLSKRNFYTDIKTIIRTFLKIF